MSGDALTVMGTTLAALIAMFAAVYTARQGRKSQEVTAERTAEITDRESQRAVQTRMLELLSSEVETLNRRVIELRSRLQNAEDFADMERTRRRDVEQKLEDLTDSVDRLRNILASLPGAADNAEVQAVLARLLAGSILGGGQA